jgi:hypothetical protein
MSGCPKIDWPVPVVFKIRTVKLQLKIRTHFFLLKCTSRPRTIGIGSKLDKKGDLMMVELWIKVTSFDNFLCLHEKEKAVEPKIEGSAHPAKTSKSCWTLLRSHQMDMSSRTTVPFKNFLKTLVVGWQRKKYAN